MRELWASFDKVHASSSWKIGLGLSQCGRSSLSPLSRTAVFRGGTTYDFLQYRSLEIMRCPKRVLALFETG